MKWNRSEDFVWSPRISVLSFSSSSVLLSLVKSTTISRPSLGRVQLEAEFNTGGGGDTEALMPCYERKISEQYSATLAHL